MDFSALAGAMDMPVVERLRAVHRSTKPGTRERINAAAPVIGELEKVIDPYINSALLGPALWAGRTINKNLPSVDTVRYQFAGLKRKLRSDKAFFSYVADCLPKIAAKYSSANIFDIVSDPDFLELLKRGVS